MLARNDLADYLADNYGSCRITPCRCLKYDWRQGRACRNWVPVEAQTWDELRAIQRRVGREYSQQSLVRSGHLSGQVFVLFVASGARQRAITLPTAFGMCYPSMELRAVRPMRIA